jgi:hypothetical protein
MSKLAFYLPCCAPAGGGARAVGGDVAPRLPSAGVMAVNAVKAVVSTAARAARGQGILAAPEIQAARQVVCEGCDRFRADKRCAECGCKAGAENWLLNKWKYEGERCPLGKWGGGD